MKSMLILLVLCFGSKVISSIESEKESPKRNLPNKLAPAEEVSLVLDAGNQSIDVTTLNTLNMRQLYNNNIISVMEGTTLMSPIRLVTHRGRVGVSVKSSPISEITITSNVISESATTVPNENIDNRQFVTIKTEGQPLNLLSQVSSTSSSKNLHQTYRSSNVSEFVPNSLPHLQAKEPISVPARFILRELPEPNIIMCQSRTCDLATLKPLVDSVAISPGNQNVRLISSSNSCNVAKLSIAAPMSIARSVVNNCRRLKELFFHGSGWNCGDPFFGELLLKHSFGQLRVHANRTSCREAHRGCNRKDLFYQISCKEASTRCGSSVCACHAHIQDYTITVECSHRAASTHTLPRVLPKYTQLLYLDNNTLEDVTPIIQQLPHLPLLRQVFLNNNHLRYLPVLPSSTSPKVQVLLLHHNQFKQFDSLALESYLRVPHLAVSLGLNPWHCDCNARYFMSAVQDRYELVMDKAQVFCEEDQQRKRPWLLEFSSCESPSLFSWWRSPTDEGILCLVVLNLVALAVFADLQKALREARQGQPLDRVPWAHSVVVSVWAMASFLHRTRKSARCTIRKRRESKAFM